MSFIADIALYDKEKPYELFMNAPVGIQKTNCQYVDHHSIEITDARGHEAQFQLDTSGFVFLKRPYIADLRASDFSTNDDEALRVLPYLQFTTEIIKNLLSAEKVVCFDWRVCSRYSEASLVYWWNAAP